MHIRNTGAVSISSALLKGERCFYSEYGVKWKLPSFIDVDNKNGISISIKKKPFERTLHCVPREFVVGMGCRKGIPASAAERFFLTTLKEHSISPEQVCAIATIDLKKDEKAILSICRKYSLELKTCSKEALLRTKGAFTASAFVKSAVGVDDVCERAAVAGSGNGDLILRNRSRQGVTIAIAKRYWECRL